MVKKQPISDAIVTGYVRMLKNCSKVGDPVKNAGGYRRDVLENLQKENEQLYNAVIKRLGDK